VVAALKKMKLTLEGGKLQLFFRQVLLQNRQVAAFEFELLLFRRNDRKGG